MRSTVRTVAGAIAVLWLLQALLMPKYTASQREGALIGEYYANAGSNDVIFLGDCEVYETFSPVTLWQEYGIVSYIRGSPQQTIWQSYYLLEEMLRYETPRVVVFNVLSMKYDTVESTGNQTRREALNRMTLDGMRWSGSKWKAILASMTREERSAGGILTYLFPLLRFHDRWKNLGAEDVTALFHREAVSDNGYLMQTGVMPLTDAHAAPPLADERLGENSWAYLDRITALCREQGVQLVLIKAPVLYPVWWWEWDEQVSAYAKANDLLYINMLRYQQQIGIDWQTDTYDTGLHLNVWGAEKASLWLGKVLCEQCSLPDRRDDPALCAVWAKKTEIYEQRKQNGGVIP